MSVDKEYRKYTTISEKLAYKKDLLIGKYELSKENNSIASWEKVNVKTCYFCKSGINIVNAQWDVLEVLKAVFTYFWQDISYHCVIDSALNLEGFSFPVDINKNLGWLFSSLAII